MDAKAIVTGPDNSGRVANAGFIELVSQMRRAQKMYYSVKSKPNLKAAISFEHRVDSELKKITEKFPVKPKTDTMLVQSTMVSLFDNPTDE